MAKRKNELKPVWCPRVLTEFEIGMCDSAIVAIERQGKPFADISQRSCNLVDLKADLAGCLKSHKGSGVKYWTMTHRQFGCVYHSYGFYKEPWTLAARIFLDKKKLSQFDRSWINGLLFGYRTDQIQKFIDNGCSCQQTKRATKR